MSLPPSNATTITISAEEEAEVERTIRERRRKGPMRSQFDVPLWELAADALRTAWLSPIILTLTKPEVTIFLIAFVFSTFVHGTRIPFLPFDFVLDVPTIFIAGELAYLLTFRNNPRRTGSRRWVSMRRTWLYDEIAAYFYTHIIRTTTLNPKERHVMGYHPHGMFPMGASYLHNLSQWGALFPGIECVSLVATVCHIVPLLRDVTQYVLNF